VQSLRLKPTSTAQCRETESGLAPRTTHRLGRSVAILAEVSLPAVPSFEMLAEEQDAAVRVEILVVNPDSRVVVQAHAAHLRRGTEVILAVE